MLIISMSLARNNSGGAAVSGGVGFDDDALAPVSAPLLILGLLRGLINRCGICFGSTFGMAWIWWVPCDEVSACP